MNFVDWPTLGFTIIAIIIGFFTTRHYYKKSSEQLVSESAKLRAESEKIRESNVDLQHLINLITRALEEGKTVSFNRDENGKAIGLIHLGRLVIDAKSETRGTLSTIEKRSD